MDAGCYRLFNDIEYERTGLKCTSFKVLKVHNEIIKTKPPRSKKPYSIIILIKKRMIKSFQCLLFGKIPNWLPVNLYKSNQ